MRTKTQHWGCFPSPSRVYSILCKSHKCLHIAREGSEQKMQMAKASSYCIFIVAEIKIKASQCYHHLRKKLFTLLINTFIPSVRRSDTNMQLHLGKIKARVKSESSEGILKKKPYCSDADLQRAASGISFQFAPCSVFSCMNQRDT